MTIEGINAYAARSKKLGFINLKRVSLNERIALNDELDHLGMHIARNCYSLEVDNIPKEEIPCMTGYREDLARWRSAANKRHNRWRCRFKAEPTPLLHKAYCPMPSS